MSAEMVTSVLVVPEGGFVGGGIVVQGGLVLIFGWTSKQRSTLFRPLSQAPKCSQRTPCLRPDSARTLV